MLTPLTGKLGERFGALDVLSVMGDGGSYFLGYVIAGLSIMGSIKSQVGAAMLIPVVALGILVFDTILSPICRFILGKEMFYPDNGHIHHRLKEMGFSTKRVVWTIYGISFCLCALSVALVNVRDEQAGLFLILLGAGAVIFIRKLGYLEYFTSDKIYGWFKDITDEAGFSYDRRSFLSLQIQMGKSGDLEEVWQNLCTAAGKLEFDMAELHLCRRREDRDQRSEVRRQKSEDRGQRSEVRGRKSGKDRGQRSEVRGQKTEVRGQRAEVRKRQRSEVRGQRSEGGSQEKTEVRSQRSEVRGRRTEGTTVKYAMLVMGMNFTG